ncbi:hypothetical protein [Paraferrimonas sp. SM1919]|uniref:hypothetical protein n=1 Tax=Paraferrimonas sp. SM1919 TaxID=2662263 RepID=UPI0013D0B7D7|nr:hypothetical protein [Paraferrimonas sp. SM1919]
MSEEDLLVEPDNDSGAVSTPATKGRQSFRQVRRELTEEELASPAAQRLILDELDRLEEENVSLKRLRTEFHTVDKKASVLNEKLKRHNALDILSSAALAAGSLSLGYAPKVWAADTATGPIFLVIGIVLIASGIWAKAVRT